MSATDVRRLPRPRAGFEPFAVELIQLAVSHPALQGKDFDAQQLLAELQAYADSQPRVAAAENQLDLERQGRLSHGSFVWRAMLRIYQRAQAEAPDDRDLQYMIARFEAFMSNKRRTKQATPVTATPAAPGQPVTT